MKWTASIVLLAISACAGNDLYRGLKADTQARIELTKTIKEDVIPDLREGIAAWNEAVPAVQKTSESVTTLADWVHEKLDYLWLLVIGAVGGGVSLAVRAKNLVGKAMNGKKPITGPAK